MHNNRGNQTKDGTTSSNSTDRDLSTSDSELGGLAAQLETTIPNDVVDQTFRASLQSKLLDLQEHAGKDIQERVGKK
jgi:hypothetical protein